MKFPIPFNPQPWTPQHFPRFIGITGLALLGCMIPSHAFSQNAARSNQLANRNQPGQNNQPARSKKPNSNRRTKSHRSSQSLQTLENLFVPPQGRAPQSTANSATRNTDKCNENEASIRAIGPSQGYGLTASDRPAITLDLPPTSAQQVVLLFHSESGELDHRAWLPIPPASPQQSGRGEPSLKHLTQFQLPADQPGLQAGQRYRWSLVVMCGEMIEPDDPTFMGWVKYQAPTPEEQQILIGLSAEEQQRWYGERGYWYDMVQP